MEDSHLVEPSQGRVLEAVDEHAEAAQPREEPPPRVRLQKVLHHHVRDDVTRGLRLLVAREGHAHHLGVREIRKGWASAVAWIDRRIDLQHASH